MGRVLNKDYIAFIYQESDGRFVYKEEDILHPQLHDLEQIFLFGNNYLVLQKRIREVFPLKQQQSKYKYKYRYCYPNDYDDRYIEEATYPPRITSQRSYDQYIHNIEEQAKKDLRDLLHNSKGYSVFLRDATELYFAISNPQKYAIDRLNKRIERWMYARDYETKLLDIQDRFPNCIYTHDGHGCGHNYSSRLTEDLEFTLRSNFAYGRSSYFFVNFKYKGISLLPYSTLVNYYYVNVEKLVRYTRNYRPIRARWKDALNEITEISRLAVHNTEEFVRLWLINELDAMMKGLEEFMSNPEFIVQRLVRHPRNDARKFVAIEDVDDALLISYKVKPNRVTFICKVFKISSALKVIANMRQIAQSYGFIKDYIERILMMNGKILEETNSEIIVVDEEIGQIEQSLSELKKTKEIILTDLSSHLKSLANLKRRLRNEEQAEKKYRDEHPQYVILQENIEKCQKKNEETSALWKDTKNYYIRLTTCASDILSYWYEYILPKGIVEEWSKMSYEDKMRVYERYRKEYNWPTM